MVPILLIPAPTLDVVEAGEHRVGVVALGPVGVLGSRQQRLGIVRGPGERLGEDVEVHRVVLGLLRVVAEAEVDQERLVPLSVPAADPDVSRRRVSVDEAGVVDASEPSAHVCNA